MTKREAHRRQANFYFRNKGGRRASRGVLTGVKGEGREEGTEAELSKIPETYSSLLRAKHGWMFAR